MAATKTAKKSPARKTTSAKKTTARKATVKKRTTKKATVKKASPKKATVKKTPAKKTPTSPAPKKTSGGLTLSKPQKRILSALASFPSGLSVKEVAKKAKVNSTLVGNYAGYQRTERNDPALHVQAGEFQVNMVRNSLVNQKLVSIQKDDNVGVYLLTAAGKKAAQALK